MKKLSKEEISQKALKLFSEQGYNNVTVNDICDECGITKPTFYKYAGSKDELILDLYDVTIHELITDPYHFITSNTHCEQLIYIFTKLIRDTEKFGSDLFSQMLISNLNENHNSFDFRESLTRLCVTIIEKAQEKGEIQNMNPPAVLYRSIAYMFSGYEMSWCIKNGETNWEEEILESIEAVLDVREEYRISRKTE